MFARFYIQLIVEVMSYFSQLLNYLRATQTELKCVLSIGYSYLIMEENWETIL